MERTHPLVSVIIPCFRQGRYLPAALESVHSQTYPAIETIVVDDGSDDEHDLGMFGDWKYPRVQLIRQENRGLAKSRNRGVLAAKGEFFVFLDADDRIHPDFVSRTCEALVQTPDAGWAPTWWRDFGTSKNVYRPRVTDYEFLLMSTNVFPVTSLVRRTAFEQVGGFEALGPAAPYEDWHFWLSLSEAGWKAKVVEEVLFLYRRYHALSMGKVGPKQHLKVYEQILDLHRDYVQKHCREALLARAVFEIDRRGKNMEKSEPLRDRLLNKFWFSWQRRCFDLTFSLVKLVCPRALYDRGKSLLGKAE